jgi:uncharacterized protein (TIGR02145 family)
LLFTVFSIITLNTIAQVPNTFTDTRDGKVYKTIVSGSQTWMAENLAFIANSGAREYDKSLASVYGILYTWNSANSACPVGWHLPSDADWAKLANPLGVRTVAGGKLKEKGTSHWLSPNTEATNVTGFTALPGGYCNKQGVFSDIGKAGYWWSASEKSSSVGSDWSMYSGNSDLSNYGDNKEIAVSVRCIKD